MYALYLWPGICETVLGAGNTRLSATFLSSRKSFWLTIIWTGSKARQRIMLMKTIKFVRSTQYRLAVYSRYAYAEPDRTNFKLNFRATITNDGDKFHAARCRRQRIRISAWMPPIHVWLSHSGCLPGCLPGQTEVIINARHARLFRDLCVRKIRDRVANNVNGDGIQNDARRAAAAAASAEESAMDYAMRQHPLPGRDWVWDWPEPLANHKSQL